MQQRQRLFSPAIAGEKYCVPMDVSLDLPFHGTAHGTAMQNTQGAVNFPCRDGVVS
jgi:hypothetical protein